MGHNLVNNLPTDGQFSDFFLATVKNAMINILEINISICIYFSVYGIDSQE